MKEKIRKRIDVLRPLLKDDDPDVRLAAAQSIEKLETSCDIERILNTLRTGDTGSRIASIYALGKIGGEKVLPALIYCADRPEADIRVAAVDVLGILAHPAGRDVLLARLDDQNSAVQARAITALSHFPSSAQLCSRLRTFLEASDGSLEAEAALALAGLGDIASKSSIIALLKSSHASTRKAAAEALSSLPL